MFTGSYPLSVDDKGRIAIPSRLRAQLLDQNGPQLFITRGPQFSIEIYPVAVFHEVADQIRNLPDRKAAEMLSDVFVGHAMDVEMDKQGRVLLPAVLRDHARIKADARVVGKITRLDVWAEELWSARYGEAKAAELENAFALVKR